MDRERRVAAARDLVVKDVKWILGLLVVSFVFFGAFNMLHLLGISYASLFVLGTWSFLKGYKLKNDEKAKELYAPAVLIAGAIPPPVFYAISILMAAFQNKIGDSGIVMMVIIIIAIIAQIRALHLFVNGDEETRSDEERAARLSDKVTEAMYHVHLQQALERRSGE